MLPPIMGPTGLHFEMYIKKYVEDTMEEAKRTHATRKTNRSLGTEQNYLLLSLVSKLDVELKILRR